MKKSSIEYLQKLRLEAPPEVLALLTGALYLLANKADLALARDAGVAYGVLLGLHVDELDKFVSAIAKGAEEK